MIFKIASLVTFFYNTALFFPFFSLKRVLRMKILAGSSALSTFRINKILTSCREQSIPIINIEAQYIHFVDLTDELIGEQQSTLDKLLQYGPKSAKAPFHHGHQRQPI